jgi:hypothetical protein
MVPWSQRRQRRSIITRLDDSLGSISRTSMGRR